MRFSDARRTYFGTYRAFFSWFPAFIGTTINLYIILAIFAYGVVGHGTVGLNRRPVAGQVTSLLWFSLLCGLASASTVEILKRFFGLRGIYQRKQTLKWFRGRTGDGRRAFSQLIAAMGLDPRVVVAMPFPVLVPNGSVSYLFNLPTEQLAAQVSSAADVALTHPAQYASLLRGLARSPSDATTSPLSAMEPAELTPRVTAGGRTGVGQPQLLQREPDDLTRATRSGVDQLQISLGQRWRRYVQTAAVWISGLYGIGLASSGASASAPQGRFVLAALLVGGFFAWLVHDLAAIGEHARR